MLQQQGQRCSEVWLTCKATCTVILQATPYQRTTEPCRDLSISPHPSRPTRSTPAIASPKYHLRSLHAALNQQPPAGDTRLEGFRTICYTPIVSRAHLSQPNHPHPFIPHLFDLYLLTLTPRPLNPRQLHNKTRTLHTSHPIPSHPTPTHYISSRIMTSGCVSFPLTSLGCHWVGLW